MVAETAAPVDESRSPGPGIGIPAAIGAVATGDFDAAGLTAGNGAPVDERSPRPGIGIPGAIGAIATGDFDAAGLVAWTGAPIDER